MIRVYITGRDGDDIGLDMPEVPAVGDFVYFESREFQILDGRSWRFHTRGRTDKLEYVHLPSVER